MVFDAAQGFAEHIHIRSVFVGTEPEARIYPRRTKMAERVALVTGAGRGLGRAMALALLNVGHRVFLTSTDRATLEETRQASCGGERAALATADLGSERSLAQLVGAAEAAFGRVDAD
jgi:NAD(P)-dependent dehydrogenase (short-subunit alcohol dehydrogenase family)